VPGVVAAVTDPHDTIYEGAFGHAQTRASRSMQPDTLFRIASMTKMIATIAVLMLHEQGRIDLDAPFQRYFPEFRQPPVLGSFDQRSRRYTTYPAAQPITVRQLLTHTSGFGYWFLNSELRALMTGEPEYYNPPFLMFEPGRRFAYGISTDVLGQLIAPLSGSGLDEFFEQRILGPLDMRDTGFDVPADARLATLSAQTQQGFIEAPNETAGERPRGGGGLYSTARDYLILLRLLLNDGRLRDVQLLTPASVREITRNQIGELAAERQLSAAPQRSDDFLFMDGSQKFGLGVLLETRARPNGRAVGSYGWAGIYNTYFWVDPAAQIGAVVFMQVSPFSAPVCIELCERFELAVYASLVQRQNRNV